MADYKLYESYLIDTVIYDMGKAICLKRENEMPAHDRTPLLLLGNLHGCLYFMADLSRHIHHQHEIGFIQTSSYGHAFKSGAVETVTASTTDIADKHVIVVDDVLDTGKSAKTIITQLMQLKPARLELAVLLDKPGRRETFVQPSYVGFSNVPDVFLYGFGMDLCGTHRNLRDIWVHDEQKD